MLASLLFVVAAGYPPSILEIVPIRGGGTQPYLAWAVPVGPDTYLTAGHSVEAPFVTLPTGPVRQVRRLSGDVAVIEATASRWLRIAAELPAPGDAVYYRTYVMPGAVPTVVRGWFLAVDSDGMIHIDGYGSQGASGSAVVDENGDVVAIVSRGRNPAATLEDGSVDWKGALKRLDQRSHCRPVLLATPVVGLPGLPRTSP